MSSSTTEYQNDHLTVQVSKEPGCRVTFHLTISPKGTQSAYAKAIKIVNKEVSLPGFRKGKAPEKMVVEHYAKYIEQEWQDVVVNTAFTEAVELTKIQPWARETIRKPQVKKCSKDEGAEVILQFESQPELPSVDPKSLHIKKVKPEPITEAEINESIEQLRRYHNEWPEVTDRAVQDGDFVDLDIDVIDSGEYRLCNNSRFEVAKGQMGDWMRRIVIGLKTGETAEGMSEQEGEASAEEQKAFKPSKYRIAVKAIRTSHLPEVNDALAKKAGVPDVATLHERVKESLERKAEEKAREETYRHLENALLHAYPIDLPTTLIEREKNVRLKNKAAGIDFSKMSDKDSQDEGKRIVEQLSAEAQTEAERSLKVFFILRKTTEEHKLPITQDDLVKELTRQLQFLPVQEREIDEQGDPQDVRYKLISIVSARKAKDKILESL